MMEILPAPTVAERARSALANVTTEEKLRELAKSSTSITMITNADGRAQCHAALMVLRNTRIAIEKAGKAARDDATKFSKAVIAEEDRLVAIISDEEERLEKLRAEWDDRLERERQERVRAEEARVAGIRQRIDIIREIPRAVRATSTSAEIGAALAKLTAHDIDATYAEFREAAQIVKDEAVRELGEAHLAARQREAREEEIAREKAELERQRAEAAEREAAEAARRKAEEERIAEERRKLEEERAAAQREREAAEERARRELEEQRAQIAREREELEARKRAEAEVAAAAATLPPAVTDAALDMLAGPAAPPAPPEPDPADTGVYVTAVPYPGDDAIEVAIAEAFDVPRAVAAAWLRAFGASGAAAA